MHRDERFWERPKEFDPLRFHFGQSASTNEAFLPFGVGPHHCIGHRFARNVALIVISEICARYDIRLIEPKIIPPRPAISLQPSRPIRVLSHRRN
jgi:cytochrome P450